MNTFKQLHLTPGKAICYSGFRDGQHPGGTSPSYEQVKEDLLLLKKDWSYLRLYDCDEHARTVFEVIENEHFDFKVMLGAHLDAEMNNFNCPWGGGVFSEDKLKENRIRNEKNIQSLIEYASLYSNHIFSLSVGNEACVDWSDHYVPEIRVIEYANQLKEGTNKLVTFCENYVPWLHKLQNLVEVLDFISIHTYPVWEYKHISEGLEYTKQNYYAVAEKYPNKPIVITEAGWATKANDKGINIENVNEGFQKIYFNELMEWTEKENILTFYFEAFDENWKGSPEPWEPEKHWGLFRSDRSPKLAVNSKFNVERVHF